MPGFPRALFSLILMLLAATAAPGATLTVNSLADSTPPGDGLVTLREAIAAANANATTDLGQTGAGADTIVFAPSLAAGTIALTSVGNTTAGPSALGVTSDVTIDGSAAPKLTISRDAAVARLRLFYVAAGARLRLQAITLANGAATGFPGGATHRGGTGGGSAGLGGAIFNAGTLEIEQCTLASNVATGGEGGPQSNIFDTYPRAGSGGGGLAGAGGDPTPGSGPTPIALDGGGVGGAAGGGAGGNGDDETCTGGSAGGFGGGGGGGGGCPNNPACNGAAGGFGGGGGAGGGGQTGQPAGSGAAGGYGAGAGGNGTSSGAITAPGGGGGGGAGMGGAVFNHGGTLTVTNSTFSGNSANGGAGGRNGGAGQGLGGAIFNRNGSLTILAVTFSGNATGNGGGAVFNLGDGGNATASISGSILANSSGPNDFQSATNGGGTQSSSGSANLIEVASGFGGAITSTADPQLGALADNDGSTITHLPALTSPVIGASTLATPLVDQRGVSRPQGTARDIGSVEVVLNRPPVAACRNVTVSANGSCAAAVTTAMVDNGSSDPDGDPLTLSLSPAGPFGLGTTNVTLTVADDSGLTSSCSATVTVLDTTAPAITCPPDTTVECPASTDPASTGSVSATDNCTASPTVSFTDVTTASCGGTVKIERTWRATDGAGNAATCTQVVSTRDTTGPVITPATNASACLWPPNGKYVYIQHVTAGVSVTDTCDPFPIVTLVGCTSNQCDDAPCPAHPGEDGDGETLNDCVYDALLDRLAVRAERAGTAPGGRTYSLFMTATDGCGNSSAPVVVYTVKVPFTQPKDATCLKP